MENLFLKKTYTFTGKLQLMSRESAASFVRFCGGSMSANTTKKTDVLVVGSFRDQPECHRNKYRTAEKYIKEGQDIEVISEDTFYSRLFACVGPHGHVVRAAI